MKFEYLGHQYDAHRVCIFFTLFCAIHAFDFGLAHCGSEPFNCGDTY